jgi:hypothetical protein
MASPDTSEVHIPKAFDIYFPAFFFGSSYFFRRSSTASR